MRHVLIAAQITAVLGTVSSTFGYITYKLDAGFNFVSGAVQKSPVLSGTLKETPNNNVVTIDSSVSDASAMIAADPHGFPTHYLQVHNGYYSNIIAVIFKNSFSFSYFALALRTQKLPNWFFLVSHSDPLQPRRAFHDNR